MTESRAIDFDDIQALARFGHGHLLQSRFLLLTIHNVVQAGKWLQQLPISCASTQPRRPESAVQLAFTAAGIQQLGLPHSVLEQFSDEFLVGMNRDENRSRRLGDIEHNAPENWLWGDHDSQPLHALLLLYSREDQIEDLYNQTCNGSFSQAFQIVHELPTDLLQAKEPFGFVDGISQPEIDWHQTQRTDIHAREAYSNLLAPGEIVLGYPDEYGQLIRRPLVRPESGDSDDPALRLPPAEEAPGLYDFGGNGSYLVLRQLEQDVDGFREFIKTQSNGQHEHGEALAACMVGRHRNGDPLVPPTPRDIPGIPAASHHNHFDYDADPAGLQCPLGSHVRRSNPRTGDFPPGSSSLWIRLLRMLGFKRRSTHEDLVASSRFHRILRRGRIYNNAGLQFICVGSNIRRQFEFVQSAWSVSSTFAGTREQRDPLIGHRQPRIDGSTTSSFLLPGESGAQTRIRELPTFVTVRGGGYFFMPGLRAVRYLAYLAEHSNENRCTGEVES